MKDRHVRPVRGVRARGPAKAAGSRALGPPLHRMPGKAGSRPALVSLGFRLREVQSSPNPSSDHSRQPSLLWEFVDGVTCRRVSHLLCDLCGGELASMHGCASAATCWASLDPVDGPVCTRCGLPFPSPHALDSSVAECGACRRANRLSTERAALAFMLESFGQAVLRLKFRADERLGARLGELLAPTWEFVAAIGRARTRPHRSGTIAPVAPA